MVARPVTWLSARLKRRRRDGERVGVVGGVVVGGEVLLQQAGEAPVELDLGVVVGAALGAARVVPALDPQQDRRQQVALEVGAVLVGRARELGAEGVDQRVEPVLLAVRFSDESLAEPGARRGTPAWLLAGRGGRTVVVPHGVRSGADANAMVILERDDGHGHPADDRRQDLVAARRRRTAPRTTGRAGGG